MNLVVALALAALAPNCTTAVKDGMIYADCANYDKFRADAAKVKWPKDTQVIVTLRADPGYSHIVRYRAGNPDGELVAVSGPDFYLGKRAGAGSDFDKWAAKWMPATTDGYDMSPSPNRIRTVYAKAGEFSTSEPARTSPWRKFIRLWRGKFI